MRDDNDINKNLNNYRIELLSELSDVYVYYLVLKSRGYWEDASHLCTKVEDVVCMLFFNMLYPDCLKLMRGSFVVGVLGGLLFFGGMFGVVGLSGGAVVIGGGG